MGIIQKLFGTNQKESVARNESVMRQRLSPNVRQRLEMGIEVTKKCVAIMDRCRTKHEIFDGFRRCRTLLANMNHPLVEAVDRILMIEGTNMLDENHIRGLKDHFLRSCRAFLSATAG